MAQQQKMGESAEPEGGGSALEGDDASGTVRKVEDEHAADALVLYRTERQVVDEDDRRFAGNDEERMRLRSNTLLRGRNEKSLPEASRHRFENVDAQELCPAVLVPLAFCHLRGEGWRISPG